MKSKAIMVWTVLCFKLETFPVIIKDTKTKHNDQFIVWKIIFNSCVTEIYLMKFPFKSKVNLYFELKHFSVIKRHNDETKHRQNTVTKYDYKEQ